MFFQSIYQMITAGTDLNINIRKVDNSLSVAVMPRRNSLKEDTRQNMVPLVVNGTPTELDMGFLQTILQPIQKVQGLLANAENFEKQAEKATSQAKSSKAPTVPAESKEAKEKREKMEKLLKKADDATAAKRFSEAMTWLKQARVLASAEKQKEIDTRMQEVQKQASEGSLFGMAEEAAPVIPQPQGSMNGQPQPGIQTSIFPEQQTHTMNPEPVMQSAPQQIPQEMPQPTCHAACSTTYSTGNASTGIWNERSIYPTCSKPPRDARNRYATRSYNAAISAAAGTATDKRTYTERNGTSTERKRTGIPDCTGSP